MLRSVARNHVLVRLPYEHLAANRNHDLESLSSDSKAAVREDSCRCHLESIMSPGYGADKNALKSHLPRMAESKNLADENDVGVW